MDTWMGDLSDEKKDTPMHKLIIPGSHDTFAHSLDMSLEMGNDIEHMVKGMPAVGALKQIVYNWSRTQSLKTHEQLDAGVRYMDARVSRPDNPATKTEIRAVHGLYAQKVEEILTEVKSWLSAHATEVLLLDFNHFYNFDAELHSHLMTTIKNTLGDKLIPRCPLNELTINNVLKKKQQCVVFYQPKAEDQIEVDPDFFVNAAIRSPWSQTNLPYNMLTYQQDSIMKWPAKQRSFFVNTQGVLTANMADIMRMSSATLQAKMAQPATLATLKWLHENDVTIRPLLNIISVDFVETGDFCKKIVALNQPIDSGIKEEEE